MNLTPEQNKKKGWFQRRFGIQLFAVLLTAILLVPVVPPSPSAEASIPPSKIFDLTDPADMLLREKDVHNVTVLQSFGFDNINKHIYVAQVTQGGLQLPGESAPVSGAVRRSNGDLTITKLDWQGNILSYMYVKGAGHGVNIGVEPGIGQNGQPVAYLWTEIDSVDEGAGGRGSRVARFPFTDGAVVTPNTPWLEKHTLIDGSFNTTISLDMVHGNLIMRYRLSGVYYFSVFDLEEVKQGIYNPISTIPVPPVQSSFQGYAAYGSYIYVLEGTAYGTPGSVSPTGNTYLTSVDLNTGQVIDRRLTRAGYSLPFREPEGLAIQIPNINQPGEARLVMGFASTISSTNTNKRISLYYKDKLDNP